MIGGRPQAKILVNVVHQTGAILARREEQCEAAFDSGSITSARPW